MQTMTIPGTKSTVQFIFIDTYILRDDKVASASEWAWIEKTLQWSRADWIIMAGHYPGMFLNLFMGTRHTLT